jgi:hypothetical protein
VTDPVARQVETMVATLAAMPLSIKTTEPAHLSQNSGTNGE